MNLENLRRNLVSRKELGERLGISRRNIDAFCERRTYNGSPEPIKKLGAGPHATEVYWWPDWRDWYRAYRSTRNGKRTNKAMASRKQISEHSQ